MSVYTNLIELHRQKGREALGPAGVVRRLFESGQVKPKEIDLTKLWCECFGYQSYYDCKHGLREGAEVVREAELAEAGQGAVTSAAFTNISGQFVYQTTLDAYRMEEGIFTKLVPERDASSLDGEKIAGVTEIGNRIARRSETMPYAQAGVGENWVFTPPIVDQGVIISLSWESLFNEKTGQLAERARDVGKWGAFNREIEAIDAFLDDTSVSGTTAHRYNWRNAGQIQTFGDNSGTHSWDNLVASNALVDQNNLNAAEQQINLLVDPFTGAPIMFDFPQIVVSKALEPTAYNVLNTETITRVTPGYATSGNPQTGNVANQWRGRYQPVSSRLLSSRMALSTNWYLANIAVMLRCMVAERPNVVQAPDNTDASFRRRIVNEWRYNDRLQYVVVEPRAALKNTA
jgi:hypothetical protein